MLAGLPGILNLAAAGGTDLAIASDIVTDGLTGLNLTANDSSKFVDIMAATITNANTNVEMMGETLKYAGPVAGALGIKMEDLSLAIGLMGNAGVKASNAGTALRGGLTNLVKPTDQMVAAMEKYGVSIQKSDDGSVDLMATIKLLREKLGGLEETTQANALATIFGKEAMSGWAAIINASEADFNKLNSAIANSEGKAKDLAEIMQQNLGGSIDNMKSALEGALKDGFEAMLPVLERVVECITNAAKWFSNLDEEAQRNIVTLAGVAAALGPLLSGVGQLLIVGGNAVTLFGKLSKSTDDTYKSVGLLKKAFALLGGPTGIGVAIVATALACKAFGELNEYMQQDTVKSIDDVIKGMNGLSDKTKETITPFLELSQTVETTFMKMNASGVVMTSEMKDSVIKNLDEMTNGVSESITKSKDEAIKGLESMFQSTVSITDEEKNKIIETTKSAYDSKVETIKTSKEKINEILNNALSENRELSIEEENQIRTHYKNIKDISLESMVATKEELLTIKKELNINSKELSAQQASDVIKEANKQRDESIKAAQDEYEKRLDYAATLRSQGGAENEALAQKVISEATRMKDEQVTQANLAADGVISAARTQAGEYVKNIDYMTGEVRNGWEQLGFDLDSVFYNLYYSLIESFQNMGSHTQLFFNEMKSSLLQFVLDSIDWWRQLPFTDDNAFEGIYENCKKSLDSTKEYIASKNKEIEEIELFQNLPGRVKEQLSRLSPVLEEYFKVPMEKLLFDTQIWSNMTTEEFYKLPPNVQDALRKIDQSLVEAGQGSLESFLQRTKMTNEGVIFSFDQLDSDVRNSMTNLNNSLLDLNGINLDQFVMQCVSAADGGKSAFEALPDGVQASIEGLNSILVDRHNMTLEQFILNTKIVTGEYKDVVNTNTKEAAQNADNNTKDLANKIDLNTKDSKDKADKNTKDLKDSVNNNTKNAANDADKNTKDLSTKVNTNTKNANNYAKTNMDKAAKDVGNATSKMASEAKKGTSQVAKNTDEDFKKANKSVQQSATDMYNGAKKSYSELAKSGKQSLTDLYNGGKKSVDALTKSVKQGATDAYNGSKASFNKIPSVVNAALELALANANKFKSGFRNSGTGAAQSWIDGFNSKKSAMSAAISAIPKPRSIVPMSMELPQENDIATYATRGSSMASSVSDALIGTAESVDVSTYFRKSGENSANAYAEGLSTLKDTVPPTLDKLTELVNKHHKEIKELEDKKSKNIKEAQEKLSKELIKLNEDKNKKIKELEDKRAKSINEANSKYAKDSKKRNEAIKKATQTFNEDIKRLDDKYKSDLLKAETTFNDSKKKINEKYAEDSKKLAEKQNQEKEKLYREQKEAEINFYEKLKEIKETYNDKLTSLNQKYLNEEKKLNEEYQKIYDSRVKSLTGWTDIFSEVKSKDVSGDKLLENLQGQVDVFKAWDEDMNELSSKIGKDLYEELLSKGPQAHKEIEALNSLSKEELERYEALFLEKKKLAEERAKKDTADEKRRIELQIQSLKDSYIKEYNDLALEMEKAIDKQLDTIKTKFGNVPEAIFKAGQDSITEFLNGLNQVQLGISDSSIEVSNTLVNTEKKIKKTNELIKTEFKDTSLSVSSSSKDMATNVLKNTSLMVNDVCSLISKMANFAVSEWERIRNIYSIPIQGEIIISKREVNSSGTDTRSFSLPALHQIIDVRGYKLAGEYFTSNPNVIDKIGRRGDKDNKLEMKLDSLIDAISNFETFKQENNIVINEKNYSSPSRTARQIKRNLEDLGKEFRR